jgi:hypothetical protein
MTSRRGFLTRTAAVASVFLLSRTGLADDRAQWAEESFELTGVIVVVRLSSPPGELIVVADGKDWTVIIGEPWLRARAGLSDAMLVRGVIATFQGRRAKDKNVLRLNAARVLIKGKPYDLSAPKT